MGTNEEIEDFHRMKSNPRIQVSILRGKYLIEYPHTDRQGVYGLYPLAQVETPEDVIEFVRNFKEEL